MIISLVCVFSTIVAVVTYFAVQHGEVIDIVNKYLHIKLPSQHRSVRLLASLLMFLVVFLPLFYALKSYIDEELRPTQGDAMPVEEKTDNTNRHKDTVIINNKDRPSEQRATLKNVAIICQNRSLNNRKIELDYDGGYRLPPIYVVNRGTDAVIIKEIELIGIQNVWYWQIFNWGSPRQNVDGYGVFTLSVDQVLNSGQDYCIPEIAWMVEHHDQTHSDQLCKFQMIVYSQQAKRQIDFNVVLKKSYAK